MQSHHRRRRTNANKEQAWRGWSPWRRASALALAALRRRLHRDETKANEDKAAELRRLRRPQHGRQPVGRLRGRRLRRRRRRRDELGCKVNYKDLKEDVSWQGFGTGDVDVVIEDWGHPDLEKKFFAEQGDGSAMDLGPTGNVGIIGWYVPPWLAEEHPDILEWENLNKYASEFSTSETGDKGQFLGADPSYVQFDESIISNLDLDFKVVFSGSEAASITAFQQAEKNKEFMIGYFYEPQWLFADLPLAKVALPPYEDGCQDDPAKVDCDYPETTLKKIASTEWVEEGSAAVDVGPELHLDQRRPEPGREVHLRGRHVRRGRRGQVGRGQPRQGRGVAGLSLPRP